jgi:predicted lipoprotein
MHVVPLEATRRQSSDAGFDAAAYVDALWSGPLLETVHHAVDASELLAAFRRDSADTAARFGHRLGLGGASFYFVQGRGKIVAVEDDAIAITLSNENSSDAIIELGPVFGNAIRDGSGLLDVSDFANAQNFNELSTEINRRVEEQVLPVLQESAAVGREVRFAGGAEVADSAGIPSSLVVVPVIIEFP